MITARAQTILMVTVAIIARHPARVLMSFGILFVAAFLSTGMVRFDRDVFKVLPRENPLFTVLLHAMDTSTAKDRLMLLVQTKQGSGILAETVNRLIQDLETFSIDGRNVFQQITFQKSEVMGREAFEKLLQQYLDGPELFLNSTDRRNLRDFLRSTAAMERELRKSVAMMGAPGQSRLSGMIARDPLNLRRFLMDKIEFFQEGLSFAPGPYLLSTDGRAALVMAKPAAGFRQHAAAGKLLRELKIRLQRYPMLDIGITGGFAIAAQEESLIRGDILGCLIGSVAAISLLFLLVYRNIIVLSFILIPLGIGLQLAVGSMALVYDAVHILALAFGAVILGLGIDFAIHVYDRYTSERRQGSGIEKAVRLSVAKTGSAVLAGGITTLAAFFVITLADSPVLVQIGWLVLLGLFFCMAAVVWGLPAWLVLAERLSPNWLKRPALALGMNGMGNWIDRHPRKAVAISLLFLLFAASGLTRAGFERDIFALKPQQLEALDVQQELAAAFGSGHTYVLVSWNSRTEDELWHGSRRLDGILAKAASDGLQISWSSMTRFSDGGYFHVTDLDRQVLADLFSRYGLNLSEFTQFDRFVQRLPGNHAEPARGGLCERYPGFFQRFFICNQDAMVGITWVQADTSDTLAYLQKRLGESETAFLCVNPQLAIDDFVQQSRTYLWQALGLAGLFVMGILLFYFRSPGGVLLATVPVLMGLATTAGLMGWFGVHLNVFNFIVLPILVGIGLDDGIHILARYQECASVPATIQSTGRSILMTTLTTICGFGSLYLARYHVLESMGLFAIVGIAACFFFSIVTLTALLKLMERPLS